MDLKGAVVNGPTPKRTHPHAHHTLCRLDRQCRRSLPGTHGAVTEQAQKSGCSRQCVYDHAQKVMAAVEAEHGGGPTREELIRDNEALRRENAQLWDWLFQTIEFPLAKQQAVRRHGPGHGLEPQPNPRPCWRSFWAPRHVPVAPPFIAGSKPPPPPPVGPQATGPGCQDLRAGRLPRRDLLPPPTGPGRGRTPQHGLVPGEEGRQLPGCDLVRGIEALEFVALAVVCDAGSGPPSGHRPVPTGPPSQPSESVPLEKGLDVFHTKQEARRV